jgi:phage gpG-like protein
MGKVRPLAQFLTAIKRTQSIAVKAHGLALVATTQDAERFARQHYQRQFPGSSPRSGYTKSGRLLNAIYSDYDAANLKSFVGVKGIPYGAIHEYGGTIVPKKAKFLWIRSPQINKKGGKYRRMTPSEFYQRSKSGGEPGKNYVFWKTKAGSTIAAVFEKIGKQKEKFTPLFFLKKKVQIPARPYIAPGIRQAIPGYSKFYNRFFRDLINE